jgi:hypothetical protein
MVKNSFKTVFKSVEQRTENPCVAGSIPADTTKKKKPLVERLEAFLLDLASIQKTLSCGYTVFGIGMYGKIGEIILSTISKIRSY